MDLFKKIDSFRREKDLEKRAYQEKLKTININQLNETERTALEIAVAMRTALDTHSYLSTSGYNALFLETTLDLVVIGIKHKYAEFFKDEYPFYEEVLYDAFLSIDATLALRILIGRLETAKLNSKPIEIYLESSKNKQKP